MKLCLSGFISDLGIGLFTGTYDIHIPHSMSMESKIKPHVSCGFPCALKGRFTLALAVNMSGVSQYRRRKMDVVLADA